MRRALHALALLPLLIPAPVHAVDLVGLELNTAENAENRCRLTFVIENKTERAIDSFKVDLVLFNPDAIVERRMIIEMGPVRGQKTNVKTFISEGDCNKIGAILVNDVTACAPPDPGVCLDGLALTSRLKGVRLYM
jgi:hypothetical protein